MQVNVHTAMTQLSKLIAAVERGEEVAIARGGKPVVRLVAMEPKRKGIVFGLLAGRLGEGRDWFEPLPEDERRLWEGRGEED